MPVESLAAEERRKRAEENRLDFSLGDDVVCGQCGQGNTATRTFCGRCGQRLWDVCPGCKGRHRIGEKFCGQCGTDLEERLVEQRQRYEKQLAEAERYRQLGEFALALARLKSLAAIEEPTFQALAQQAASLQLEVAAEQEHWERAVAQTELEAARLVQSYRYQEAVALLESVPERLWSETAAKLLREARAKRDEVEELAKEIQTLVRAKRIEELGAKIDRMLELQPKQAFVGKLAHQLRERLLAAAKQKLDADDYPAALALMDQLPRSAMSPEVGKLRDQALELNYLINDLKLSPVIDPPLISLAERMVRLRPRHPQAGRLLEAIRERASQRPDNLRYAAPAWAALRGFRLGVPVHWWAGLQRIRCTPEIDAALRKEPGKYFVACGLAIQGLGLAAIAINLLPTRETGLLKRLPAFMRRAPTSAWGLDLGITGLKAVRMVTDRQQGVVTLEAVESFPYLSPLTPLTDDAERHRLEREAIRQFIERRKPENDRVCLSVPGLMTLGRFVELPPVEAKKLDETARAEADFQFPMDLNELAWGYHVFPRTEIAPSQSTPYRSVMQAVKKHLVDHLAAMCHDTGLRLDLVQSECLALHNLAVYEFFGEVPTAGASPAAVALLDVGARATNLVVSSPTGTWFRGIGVSGESFTNALVRPLKLTREQAEQLKRDPARARRVYQLYELLESDFAHLTDEVERSLQTYRRQYPNVPVTQMFGFGGGFRMHGLLRWLCRR